MLEKKLVTLASAAGILACGACFLPPLPQHRPPPPVRIGIEGIQSIRVEVINASTTHRLDPAGLAQQVASTINEHPWNTKINAHVGKEDGEGDAVLEISVLSETIDAETPAKPGNVRFVIKDSATLTRQDGALVWRETEAGSSIARNVAEGDPADAWKNPALVDGVDKALSNRLVFRMFYGR